MSSGHKHLLIMAAGTGGHVIPGLAVAQEMQTRGWTVSWLATRSGMENQLVPPSGIPMDRLSFSGLRGKNLVETALGGIRLLKAFWDCIRVIRSRNTTAVLGMGGYICFPGGLMASLLNKPLVLVNADAALLLSNKMLLPVADRICFGFDGGQQGVKQAVLTGNPVRAAIEQLPAPGERLAARSGPLRLLVLGGSLGAKAINDVLPQAMARLPAAQRPQLLHQAGRAHAEALQSAYAHHGVQAEVRPFIDDMAAALAEADLVLCRAGAITVSELCAAGVASVLLPLVVSTTAHQRDNARFMAEAGAAIHLPQAEASPERVAGLLAGLSRERCLQMAEAARALARPQAAARVADQIEHLT